MASRRLPSETDKWERTSEPAVYYEKNTSTWRLFLNFTPRPREKARKKAGPQFSTREDAIAGMLDFRMGWEYSHRGKVCKADDTQTSTFPAGAPPPFYAWDTPRKDSKVASRTRTTTAGNGGGQGAQQDGGGGGGAGRAASKERLKERYEGKPKGEKQYLWEHGLWKEGMSAAKGVADEMNIVKILQALPEFEAERTALQHVVEKRGNMLLLSPKCHPEVAGVGIEYSWGFSKKNFRRKYNDEVPKHLHANIEKSLCPEDLTVGRVRRFARRTRDYCRAYRDIELGGGVIRSKDMIKKMRQKQKVHRNILDMEIGFLGKQ